VKNLLKNFPREDIIIISSGLAFGTDSIAHEAEIKNEIETIVCSLIDLIWFIFSKWRFWRNK
jgi:hypothetical protein